MSKDAQLDPITLAISMLEDCDRFACDALTKYVHKIDIFQTDLSLDQVYEHQQKIRITIDLLRGNAPKKDDHEFELGLTPECCKYCGLPAIEDDRIVIVCDACSRACCWKGEFMCEDARFAGTIKKTIRELKILDLENPCYWELP